MMIVQGQETWKSYGEHPYFFIAQNSRNALDPYSMCQSQGYKIRERQNVCDFLAV